MGGHLTWVLVKKGGTEQVLPAGSAAPAVQPKSLWVTTLSTRLGLCSGSLGSGQQSPAHLDSCRSFEGLPHPDTGSINHFSIGPGTATLAPISSLQAEGKEQVRPRPGLHPLGPTSTEVRREVLNTELEMNVPPQIFSTRCPNLVNSASAGLSSSGQPSRPLMAWLLPASWSSLLHP